MSIQQIIQYMKELYSRHEELLELSKQKTDLIKQGEMKELQALLVNERKTVRLAEQVELKRSEAVLSWFEAQHLPLDDLTVTSLISNLKNDSDKQQLEQEAVKLAEVVMQLKHQEKMNQDLVQQSMQFVQFSLNLLQPSIENLNYGKKDGAQPMKRSVFDSKA